MIQCHMMRKVFQIGVLHNSRPVSIYITLLKTVDLSKRLSEISTELVRLILQGLVVRSTV